MKTRIFLLAVIAILMGTFSASAQIADGEMYRKGTNLAIDGVKITSEQALGLFGQTDLYVTYTGAHKQLKAGTALITVGSIAYVTGITFNVLAWTGLDQTSQIIGLSCAAAGTFMLGAGIPLYCIGKGRMNWLADEYNSGAPKVAINVGPQRHGMGVSLNF